MFLGNRNKNETKGRFKRSENKIMRNISSAKAQYPVITFSNPLFSTDLEPKQKRSLKHTNSYCKSDLTLYVISN